MSEKKNAIKTYIFYGALASTVNGLCDVPFNTDRVSPECKRDYKLFYDAQCLVGDVKNLPWASKSKCHPWNIPYPAFTSYTFYKVQENPPQPSFLPISVP